MRRTTIHKLHRSGAETVCGICPRIKQIKTTFDWNHTNCKRCLLKQPVNRSLFDHAASKPRKEATDHPPVKENSHLHLLKFADGTYPKPSDLCLEIIKVKRGRYVFVHTRDRQHIAQLVYTRRRIWELKYTDGESPLATYPRTHTETALMLEASYLLYELYTKALDDGTMSENLANRRRLRK